ncbi:TetR/AcrR family transcriptional regulator [Nocardia sp. NBC_01388]|uniref:TetR/AcrR family transcriptional regulator n=1 Tax=Nocardia sp. NBC_01388 TaxID=2903596 RepID=UPI00324E9684
MSEKTGAPRRRRSDALRSAESVLEAAIQTLGERPDASLEYVAAAAGVSRQTLYAHFPTRDVLIQAAVARITTEVAAAIDAARLDEDSATAALQRFLDLCWHIMQRYPMLLHLPPADPAEDHDAHAPILGPLDQLIRRGQATGEFDRHCAPEWLLTAVMVLGHAAGSEVSSGRMTAEVAIASFQYSARKLITVHSVRQPDR